MKTINTHGTFEDAIGGSSPEVQSIARRLRELIIEIYPGVLEVPWPKQRLVGYGVGPKKMSEHFCYIGAQSTRVNLGFFYGAELSDPEGLMEGTGKRLRHVKVQSVEQAEQTSIRDLVQLSIKERKEELGIAD
ncbi:MAG: DUF1801 domain-containing protein [Chloroflexi bacterium]|nr:DUF1801 domain-containing protein [Chloroflexota bacterium]